MTAMSVIKTLSAAGLGAVLILMGLILAIVADTKTDRWLGCAIAAAGLLPVIAAVLG